MNKRNLLFYYYIFLFLLWLLWLSSNQYKSYTSLKKIARLNKYVVAQNSTAYAQNLYSELASLLKVYSGFDVNGPLKLSRLGRSGDGGYIIADKALSEADVLMGYGIQDDNSFEDQFSKNYNKPSYGFDCSIKQFKSDNNLFTFVDECIGNYTIGNKEKGVKYKISNFSTQLDNLKLNNKKIFIKMDIEGAEYEAFENITKYFANITGIALEIHFFNVIHTENAIKLLKRIQQDFILIHVHNNSTMKSSFTTNNSLGKIVPVIELSFINKNLLTKYYLSKDQFHPTSLDMPNYPDYPEVPFEILLDENDLKEINLNTK